MLIGGCLHYEEQRPPVVDDDWTFAPAEKESKDWLHAGEEVVQRLGEPYTTV